MNTKNVQRAKGLREFADWLENFPFDVQMPTVYIFAKDKETFAAIAKEFGTGRKAATEKWLHITKSFPGYLTIQLSIERPKICERVVTGHRQIERQVPVTTRTEIVEEEIVEWKCPDSFLAVGKEAQNVS